MKFRASSDHVLRSMSSLGKLIARNITSNLFNIHLCVNANSITKNYVNSKVYYDKHITAWCNQN